MAAETGCLQSSSWPEIPVSWPPAPRVKRAAENVICLGRLNVITMIPEKRYDRCGSSISGKAE
jgi:hypothetical protein